MKKEIIKPFDLEEYKNGAKVKTRGGSEVRIICIDAKRPSYPVIALVKVDDNRECIISYTLEGKVYYSSADSDPNDLVIVEEVEDPEFWSDKEDKEAKGYFIGFESNIVFHSPTQYYHRQHKYFASKKQAKSALAMAMISQIMANDVENFGGAITDEEWENDEWKYVIYRNVCSINTTFVKHNYFFLAFHSAEQRDLFLEKYRNLVQDYLMIG